MRKVFTLIFLFIFCFGFFKCTSPAKQKISKVIQINDFNIEINIDTLTFKSDLDFEKVFFFKEKYYSVFSNKGRSFSKKMFVLDENGNLEKEINLFQEIQRWRHFYKIQENNNKVYFVQEYSEEGFKMNLENFSFEKVSLNKLPLFQDKRYEIYESCFGEWGGVAFFKNKETGSIYETSSTCPIIINKIKSNYYLTNYMGHMIGFSSVLKVANPENLNLVKNKENFLSRNKVNDFQVKRTKRAEVLIDTLGFKIQESFVIAEKLKHIYSDKNCTYIGSIKNGKMKKEYKFDFKFKADFNHSTREGKHILTFISEDENKGILVIQNNTLYFHFIKKN